VKLRTATRDDLPRIAEVMRESTASLSVGFYDARERASAVEHITVPDVQLIDDGTYYVIEDEGAIVACGGWSLRRKLFTGGGDADATRLDPRFDAARIRAMFVLPSHTRRGLGRLLLDTSERAARDAGFHTFELMATLPGVPLYRACGYEEVEQSEIRLADGVTLGGVIMRKVVAAAGAPPRRVM
jgi:GNAT superfamily N-acetyltransferase